MAYKKLGFALCGSFCTLDQALDQMKILVELGYEIHPIMSQITYTQDTRFGTAEHFVSSVERICGRKILRTIADCEPIGPKNLFDTMLIAPCTGNTLGKLAGGITDSSVTMAAKAQLRNEKPVVLAIATNDSMTGSAPNIATLLNRKNIYFVPFGQDDYLNKPASCIADFELIPAAVEAAERGEQLQPILFS